MFGSDGSPIVQYVVIFAVIFTALAAIVFTVRRLTGRNLALPGRAGGRGRQPRLGIVDVYELDRARQLILLRRDNVEHLLLVGGPNDVVVERNIQRTQRPLPEASLRSEPAPDALDEPLPDPLVQGGRLPEPPRALAETAGRRAEPLFDPGFAMPVVVPPPVPRSAAAPPVTLPLDAALLGGDEPGQDVSAPLAPDPVAEAPIAPPRAPRESTTPRRILSRTAPPLAESPPRPASERKVEPEPDESGAAQAPSLAVPSERRSVDPAILSDMARQLQAALSRPSSAVTPAPVPAAPEGVDPVAAAMAATPPAPAPEPVPAAAIPDRPAAPVTPKPPVVSPAPPTAPEPVPAPQPPAPPPAQPVLPKVAPTFEPPVTRSDAKSAGNPFSVEEIEAEFARLLGRPLDKRS